VKPGETITGLAVGWTVEMFVKAVEEKPVTKDSGKKKEKPAPAKKAAPAKKVKPAKATPKAKPAAKKKKK
jgi:hypothetical protein